MDTILFFHHLDTAAGRTRLEGLSDFARQVGWNVHCHSAPVSETDLQALLDFWHPAGSVLSTNDGHAEYNAALFSPDSTVLQDCYPPGGDTQYAVVTTDAKATVQIALRELVGRKCATYAFVPWAEKRLWSENRRQQFFSLAATYGLTACEFRQSGECRSLADMNLQLVAWLKSLEKPIGIMAANDIVGMNVLTACRVAGISVPFDCMVVGVDNDEAICGGSNPSLSSIGMDFRAAGYKAGEILHQLISRQIDTKPVVSVPPLYLCRRGSSRIFLQTDRLALKASELILAKACEGLQAKDVLSIFPCSRRRAEMRFKTATGHSVLEEIQSVRINRAKRLLENPAREMSAIPNMCGYASTPTFCRIFKAATGMTMGEWRMAHAAQNQGATSSRT